MDKYPKGKNSKKIGMMGAIKEINKQIIFLLVRHGQVFVGVRAYTHK